MVSTNHWSWPQTGIWTSCQLWPVRLPSILPINVYHHAKPHHIHQVKTGYSWQHKNQKKSGERQTDTHTQKESSSVRERDRQRQTDRDTGYSWQHTNKNKSGERQTDRHRKKVHESERETETDRQTEMYWDLRHSDSERGTWATQRERERQTDRQTDRDRDWQREAKWGNTFI